MWRTSMINVILRIPESEQYDFSKNIGDVMFLVSNKPLKQSRPGRKHPEHLKFNNKPMKPGKNGANIFCEVFYYD